MRLLVLVKTALWNFYQSVRRFPVTIFITTATTVLLIIVTRVEGPEAVKTTTRLAMATALGIPLSLCIALAFERLKSSKAAEYGSYALGFILLALYYIFLLPDFGMVPVTRYMAVSLALYLAFLFVPYCFRRPGYELYVIKVISRFLVAAIYAGILFAGLAITLLTIDLLLGVYISFTFYTNVWTVVAGIFVPCFFLAGLPTRDEEMVQEPYPSLLKVLLLYIVLPIILAYIVILYIYFLKTLVTLEWPQGTVSHLVLWYTVFSAGLLFLIHPLVKENKFVQQFTTWFPKLILPALFVMFMAIGIRIQAYGVTENRYFVVALGIWALGVMLYYSFGRRLRNIFLPVSLALIALLVVFGPWSAYTVSVSSQNRRFEALAAQYNMVAGDTLQKPSGEIAVEDKREIVSILDYFVTSHSFDDLRLLPAGFEFRDMEQVFGFAREDIWAIPGRGQYFQFSNYGASLDIEGYDWLLNSRNLSGEAVTVGELTVQYSPQELHLVVLRGGQEIHALDLQTYVEAVIDKYGTASQEVPLEEMTFVEENGVRVKLVFTGMYGHWHLQSEQLQADNVDFYLLLAEAD